MKVKLYWRLYAPEYLYCLGEDQNGNPTIFLLGNDGSPARRECHLNDDDAADYYWIRTGFPPDQLDTSLDFEYIGEL